MDAIAVTGRKVLVVVAVAMLSVVALSATAAAHVTVHPTSVPAGSSDVEVTFRVPNERDNASTVELQVFFPTGHPILAVDVLPVPGWSVRVTQETLNEPVQSDDGPVTQVVKEVTWTADSGGIGAGRYEDFPIAAGSMPDQPGRLVFKALQTYSNGEIVRWIEVPSSGVPDPDSPAPVVTLTKSAPTVPSPVPGGSDSGDGLAIAALVVGALSLLGVIALFIRTRRESRTDGVRHGVGTGR